MSRLRVLVGRGRVGFEVKVIDFSVVVGDSRKFYMVIFGVF